MWSLLFIYLFVKQSFSDSSLSCFRSFYTQRSFFNIFKSNKNQINQFGWSIRSTERSSVWFLINRKIENAIWFRFDLPNFRKCFTVCSNLVCSRFQQLFASCQNKTFDIYLIALCFGSFLSIFFSPKLVPSLMIS